jgi:hypothetical protein
VSFSTFLVWLIPESLVGDNFWFEFPFCPHQSWDCEFCQSHWIVKFYYNSPYSQLMLIPSTIAQLNVWVSISETHSPPI